MADTTASKAVAPTEREGSSPSSPTSTLNSDQSEERRLRPKTRFLFWNLNRRPLTRAVCDIVHEHTIDVVILAECDLSTSNLLGALNSNSSEFHVPTAPVSCFKIFTRFRGDFMRPRHDSPRLAIRRLVLPAREEITLVVLHLPSKLYFDPDSQMCEAIVAVDKIREEETEAGHDRTVVVGDFNMNPFDKGLVVAPGFHAVMARSIAARGSRQIQGREYPFFYNPMWNLIGDRHPAAGTYYYERADHMTLFWNTFDQVLVRPALVRGLPVDSVRVLTTVKGDPLLRKGVPDKKNFSDHLPLVFDLEF